MNDADAQFELIIVIFLFFFYVTEVNSGEMYINIHTYRHKADDPRKSPCREPSYECDRSLARRRRSWLHQLFWIEL